MAKTIKFYMICDDHPVRTIDDLREHFGMEDVLDYYRRGILQRWLKVRGYDAELEAVKQMNATGDAEALTKLIQIFDVGKDPAEIAEFIEILKYNEEKAKAAEEKKKKEEEEKARAAIENRKKESDNQDSDKEHYLGLVNTILENSTNKAVIKSAVKEIAENYRYVFEQDYVTLFYLLYECAPMAIFVMLSFDVMREKYLSENAWRSPVLPENTLGIDSSILLRKKLQRLTNACTQSNSSQETPLILPCILFGNSDKARRDADKAKLEEQLNELNNLEKDRTSFKTLLNDITEVNRLKNILPKDLKSFSNNTAFMWRQLEPKGKECMIFKVGTGLEICPSGRSKTGKTWERDDCYGQFVLLDGIDIRSCSNNTMYYMEV